MYVVELFCAVLASLLSACCVSCPVLSLANSLTWWLLLYFVSLLQRLAATLVVLVVQAMQERQASRSAAAWLHVD